MSCLIHEVDNKNKSRQKVSVYSRYLTPKTISFTTKYINILFKLFILNNIESNFNRDKSPLAMNYENWLTKLCQIFEVIKYKTVESNQDYINFQDRSLDKEYFNLVISQTYSMDMARNRISNYRCFMLIWRHFKTIKHVC